MHLPHIDQSSCFTYLCFLILHSTFALRLQQPKCNLIAAQSGLMDLTIMISDQANFLHYHPQRPKCGFSQRLDFWLNVDSAGILGECTGFNSANSAVLVHSIFMWVKTSANDANWFLMSLGACISHFMVYIL